MTIFRATGAIALRNRRRVTVAVGAVARSRQNTEVITSSFERTIRLIREIERTITDLNQQLIALRSRARREAVNDIGPDHPLTPREKEVLALVIQQQSNKEIADKLQIAERTAKFHVGNLLEKFGVHSRQHLGLSSGGQGKR